MTRNLVFFGKQLPNLNLSRLYRENGFVQNPITDYSQAYTVPMDRLLLLGGLDIHPSWYGRRLENSVFNFPRDEIEWVLVRRALAEGVPILGICRGMQLLNVATGGTLCQDVLESGRTNLDHTKGLHDVRWAKSASWPSTVNSRHHQCVDKVGYGLKIISWSDQDDIPEAISGKLMYGIQSHPEDLLLTDKVWRNLFFWHMSGLT